MRRFVPALLLACAAPAGAAIVVHGVGLADSFASIAASLPDPATAALMFGGFGLIAGARRLRSGSRAD